MFAFLRFVLWLVLAFFIYSETGWATTLFSFLVYVEMEIVYYTLGVSGSFAKIAPPR